MYGEDIRAVQNKLNSLGYVAGTADGYYGNMTKDAIIKFQTNRGLDNDGKVGPNTWNTLFNTSTSGKNGYNRILKLTSPLMYGEDIKAVQNKLNSLGYNVGTADGYYGNGTRTAVIKFQTDKGLDTDGDVGPTTWSALFNTSISGGNNYSKILKVTSPLMYGEDIRAVQNKLNSLGYNAGTADGYYGEGTRTAVINFQTARGLDIDGEVGTNTWNTLFNTFNSGGNGVTSNIRKVFIDPGHGGTDPGASGNGLYEKEVVLSIAKKVGNILISKGFDVEFSRSTDTYVSLSDRAAQANAWDADLFVSIHCNSATSSSANGTECYTSPTANTSTKSLSKNMASALASKLALTNRGHKEANFAVLRLSNMPSILIETAFINNANDANKLKTRENDFASVIANQIANTSIEDILKVAGNIGLFENSTLTFMDLKNPTQEIRVSLYPAIYLKGELGINQSLSGSTSNGIINLALSPNTISSNIIKDLSTVNITHNIDKDTLAESIEKLTAIKKIGNTMTYSISVTNLGEIEIKLEAYLPANTELSYKPDYLPTPSGNGLKTQITVPLYKKNPETNDNVENNIIMTSIMIATAVTLVASLPIAYGIIKAGPVIGTAATFIINLITQFYSKVFS